MYELESMIGAFLGSMEFHWAPTNKHPMIVANKIDELSIGLQDMLPPMVAARQITVDDIKQHFEHEEGPDGTKWDEWSERYTKNKKPGTKLRRSETEDLYQAVTDESAYHIVGNDLVINTAGFPRYWHVHNVGGKVGNKATLPQREYLGISEAAAFEIINVFDQWVAGEVRLLISPMTGMAQRFVGNRIGGRIGMGTLGPSKLRPPGMPWNSGFSEMKAPWSQQ